MSSWFKMSLLGGAETTVRLVIKSWWGLAWVTPFWTCCFLLSIKDSLKAKQGFRWAITICPNMTSAFNFSSGMWLTLLILGRRRGVKSTVALERECKGRKLAHQLLEGPSLSCSVCTAVGGLGTAYLGEIQEGLVCKGGCTKFWRQGLGWQTHSTRDIISLTSTHGQQQQLIRLPNLNQCSSPESETEATIFSILIRMLLN